MTLLIGLMFCVNFVAQDLPCKPHRHAKIPAIKDLTYHQARKKLLAAGWQPHRTKSLSDLDISSGNGPLFWRKRYVEIEACSGTGVAACAFLFKDAFGNRLRVTTSGEELPHEKSFARITGVKFVCD